MKSVSCTIWILVALLVTATFDSLPDPPAASPCATACKDLHLRDYATYTTLRSADSLAAPDPLLVDFVAADSCASSRPGDCLVLTGQAADSSPPASQFAHKPVSQS